MRRPPTVALRHAQEGKLVDFDAIGSPEETAALLKKQRDAAVGSTRRPRLVIVGGQ
jgi:hypothetical protein